ncbi:hypothetical protein ES705_24798 [subsurface metagenome]
MELKEIPLKEIYKFYPELFNDLQLQYLSPFSNYKINGENR